VGAQRPEFGVVGFQFVGLLTTGPAANLEGITDLDVVWQGGTAVLYSSGAPSGGVSAYRLSVGQAQFLDSESYGPGVQYATAGQLETLQIGSTSALITLGRRETVLECFDLDAGGRIAGLGEITTAGGFQTPIMALEPVALNGQQWVYASHLGENGLTAYTLSAAGQMTRAFSTTTGPGAQGADLSVIETVSVQGQNLLVTSSLLENAITSYRIASNGTLTEASRMGSLDGLGIEAPTALVQTVLNGQTYLVVAASGTDSLSVLHIDATGVMQVADHALGSMSTRLGQVSVLESVTINGQVFLVAGGGDDGLSLLTLLPGGRLLHLAQIADSTDMTLNNVSALALHVENGVIEVFATGEGESGITHLRVDPGALATPIHGDAGNNTLTGTNAADLISGEDGNDRLSGGGGNDILLDGAGTDTLLGGAGADVFVFSRDGQLDVIEGFEVAQDRLDLSALGYLRNLGQLDITSTSTGARIVFGTEEIRITSADFNPITRTALEAAILMDLDHFAAPLATPQDAPTEGNDSLTGTVRPDEIDLRGGDDSYDAREGDDTIQGGTGSDTLIGGEGNDSLSGGDQNDHLQGDAGNDTLSGGASNDVLRGGTQEDLLYGDSGHDQLYGDAGFDTLYGGNGNDTLSGGGQSDNLFGGSGNDSMLGGDGNDLMQGESGADRMFGDQGNDTLWGGIDDDVMRGGTQEDFLYGEDGDDYLYGDAGFDWLEGGAGNDTLNGGAQADNLLGGLGNDILLGDQGFDRLFGQEGDDIGYGGDGPDALFGQEDNDRLYGQNGDDRFWGGTGNDLLDGGTGDDLLQGGAGFDTLLGSTGNDRLTGGFNADIFVFSDFGGGFGRDTVTDFDALNDAEKLDFSRVAGIRDFDDLINGKIVQQGDHVTIYDGHGNSVRLLYVDMADLDANDFIF
jgi:Ca2+-binding RTX toxin-like protein